MKSKLLAVCCLFAMVNLSAQTEDERWNVGVHGGSTQYSGDLGQGFYSNKQALYGFGGVSLSRYLSNRWDASLLVTRGQAGYLAARDFSQDLALNYNFRVNLTTLNLVARYHLCDREKIFDPYVFGGASVIRQRYVHNDLLHKPIEFAVPTGGIGFDIHINPVLSLQYQEMFMYSMSDDIDYRKAGKFNDSYLFHTIGLTFNLAKYHKVESYKASKIDHCYDLSSRRNTKHTAPKRRIDGKPKGKKK